MILEHTLPLEDLDILYELGHWLSGRDPGYSVCNLWSKYFVWGERHIFQRILEHFQKAFKEFLEKYFEWLLSVLILGGLLQASQTGHLDTEIDQEAKNECTGNSYWPPDRLTKPIFFVVDNADWDIRYALLSTPLVPALCLSSRELL